ncbi:MAG TPA: hydrolase [Acidobacteriota bacterium]|nr:hydrolase [Acidobacteriota bacterium]
MKTELLDRERSVLVVIDLQERMLPHVHEHERMLKRIDLLLSAAAVMNVPVLLTEQYPKGLGRTVEEIRLVFPSLQPMEKTCFSCVPAPGFIDRLSFLKRDQVVLAGVETHICVTQTAFDLAERGENVFVVTDATSSRRPADCRTGLKRLGQRGITLLPAEAVVFEWLRCSGNDEFKALQPKLKPL